MTAKEEESAIRKGDRKALKYAGGLGHTYFVCEGPPDARRLFIESASPQSALKHLREAAPERKARAYHWPKKGRLTELKN